MNGRSMRWLGLTVAAGLLLSACGGQAAAPTGSSGAKAASGGQRATASGNAGNAGKTSGSKAPTTVQIGITSLSGGYMPLYVGMQAGTWAKYGLKPAITTGAPPVLIPGLVKGSLQFLAAVSPALEGTEKGLPIRTVLVYQNHPEYLLVGAKGITSVKQLRGASLAGAAPAEFPSEMLQTMLQIKGLPPGSYKMLALSNDVERASFIESGKAKAGMLGVAEALPLLAKGYKLLASSLTLIQFPSTGLATTLSLIQHNPSLVKRMVTALLAMVQITKTQTSVDQQALEKYYHLSPAFAKQMTQMEAPGFATTGRPTAAGIKFQLQIDAKLLKLKKPLTASQEFDLSFLPAAGGAGSGSGS